MKNFLLSLFFMFSLIIGGCGSTKVDYLDTQIARIENGNFYTNCPINDGSGDDIGYLCTIKINADTKLRDSNNNDLKLEQYKIADEVRVVFTEPQAISKKNLSFYASEIVLVQSNK